MDSNNENYEALVEECRAIVTEFGFLSRWDYVSGYHALGERIVTDNGLLDKRGTYGQELVKNISKSIGVSCRNLQYAIQFYKKFPDLSMLPAGKNVSWSKIIKEYLPKDPTKKAPLEKRCPHCNGLL